MSFIKQAVRKLQNAIKKPAYLKRQTYVVRYQVTVKNIFAKPNELLIAVPVPPNREGQSVASTPRFVPEVLRLGKDGLYGNQFAVWKATLAPGESRLFTEHFTVSVTPITKKVPVGSAVSDYQHKAREFCVATDHLQADSPYVIALMREAAKDVRDAGVLATRFNELVIQRLEYGNPINGLYSALDAIQNVKVDCGGFDSLFAALCIAAKIPARIVSGFWAGYPKNDMHAWVEVQMPSGEWIPVDPSTEFLARHGRTHKLGALGRVGSDRIVFSVGCDIPLELSERAVTVDILQHPFVQASAGDRSFLIETRVETIKS